jgi:hypothetical protein
MGCIGGLRWGLAVRPSCNALTSKLQLYCKSIAKTFERVAERYDVLKKFKRTSNHLVECIEALNEGDSTLLSPHYKRHYTSASAD